MTIESIKWVQELIQWGISTDVRERANDITFCNYENRNCFCFDVVEPRRSEFSSGNNPDKFGEDYVYTDSIYLPSNTVNPDRESGIVLAQWHGRPEDDPPLPCGLQLWENQFKVYQQQGGDLPNVYLCEIPAIYDQWVDFVWQIRWRAYTRVFMNGQLIANFSGINCDPKQAPYAKFGAYVVGSTFEPCIIYHADYRRHR
jgi:hypothetical protein